MTKAPEGDTPPAWWRRGTVDLRPILLAVLALVALIAVLRVIPDLSPFGGLYRYVLEVSTYVAVGLACLATWSAIRRGQEWDADVIAVLVGSVGAFTLLVMLHSTPWGPNGLQGDPSFRTETVTRFAETWVSADFTYRGLPAFYAPGWFWILGRVSDLAGIDPWRMLKYGTIATTMVVPVFSYLLWRRIVAYRVAALIAIVPLVMVPIIGQTFYEPYAWLVYVTVIPLFVLTVSGVHRPGVPPPRPWVLGIIGGFLFLMYYHTFVVALAPVAVHFVAMGVSRVPFRSVLQRVSIAVLVAVVIAAPFWLPLGISLAQAGAIDPSVNRYFTEGHGVVPLPFLAETQLGWLSVVGVFHLVFTAREALSRALLTFLGGIFVWYLVGLPAALADYPLPTARGLPLVAIVLYTAGVLGLVRLAEFAIAWVPPDRRGRAVMAVAVSGMLLGFGAAHGYMETVRTSHLIEAAHAEPLPDGTLPQYAPDDAEPEAAPASAITSIIDRGYDGTDHPVVLSTRPDVMALNPYYGFSQWQFYYAHPAASFPARIEFLREMADAPTPERFAELAADNRYDAIDAFVLFDADDQLVFHYRDENFPDGSKPGVVAFPRSLFASAAFSVVDLGDYVVAIRR